MKRIRSSVLVPLLLAAVFLTHASSAAACKVDERWPAGTGTVQYYDASGALGATPHGNALNVNLGDWGSIFRDADDNSCAVKARSFLQAKLSKQNAVSGSWTSWLKGGDVYLMTGAALRLGARGLLTSALHGQILTALSRYYPSTVGMGCSINSGNGCMDDYSVAAAGYAWAGAYLTLTQSTVGTPGYSDYHTSSDFLVKAQDYVGRSLSPVYSVCIHHIHNRPGTAAASCAACTTDYNPGGAYANNAADLRWRISNGDTEVLSYEHGFENASYGVGLLTSVATAVLGLRRAGVPYAPSDFQKVVAHGLLRNGQLRADPYATVCDTAWTHNYCVTPSCTATNVTCITNVCAAPPPPQKCYDQFGSYEYNPGMFPVRGLLSREYALTSPSDLILGSPYFQFNQFNGFCSQTPFRTYSPGEYNDFFNDGRWAAYYTLPVEWSTASYSSDPRPRLAGVNPVQYVDQPTGSMSQPVHSGPNTFFGWAFDGEGFISGSSFSFKIDGSPISLQGFGYGGSRTDVCAYYGLTNQPASCPVGWGGTYTPPANLATGWHTLQVTVTSSTGSVSTFKRSFYFKP
ncbi:MAG TPA: hypothetical protein VF756_20340 [Thermoanaerobaculia bacterium]